MFKKLFLFFFCLAVFFSQAAVAIEPLKVMLDWQLNQDHVSLWAAQHYRFFQKEGLEVTLIPPSDPSDPAKFVAAGKVNMALTYEPQYVLQRARGLPVVWVATLVDKPLASVLVSPNIKSMADLKGKTIAYSSDAVDKVFLSAMLRHAGLKLSDVHLVNAHYDGMQAFAAGRVDAVTGVMRHVEPLALEAKGVPFNQLYPEHYGVPPYAELILVAHQDHANDPRIVKFQRALKAATEYTQAHPTKVWEAFVAEHPEFQGGVNERIWESTYPAFSVTPEKVDLSQDKRLGTFLDDENSFS